MIQIEDTGKVRKFRLARGLFGKGWYFTAAYWVDGLLVDSGCFYTAEELVKAVESLPLQLIVNTHSHEDHVGANASLQAGRGVPVLAHRQALPVLEDPSLNRLHPYQRVLWGRPHACRPAAIPDVVETEHYRFHVIHTPGHSPDHICLFEPSQGWLFAGDTYVGGQDRTLRADYNIWGIVSSLKKLIMLEPAVLFPGSGTVRDEATKELRKKISYLEEMGQKVQAMHKRGWSMRRIARTFGADPVLTCITVGHFSSTNLVRSFIEDFEEPGEERS
ncbi:MAG: MBL fold metallo-hydrolase [Thermodesulfobacteriota bacterium]